MADFEILTAEEIAELQKWDTPSVCNALEIICPERRTRGYTVDPPDLLVPRTSAPWSAMPAAGPSVPCTSRKCRPRR